MAIYPELDPADSGAEATRGIDIEAWTVEQAAEALAATRISPPPTVASPLRGTSVAIEIPLDGRVLPSEGPKDVPTQRAREAVHTVYRRREPIRRDSLKRREALLKGKEGSRRRQRWENGRLYPALLRNG